MNKQTIQDVALCLLIFVTGVFLLYISAKLSINL